MTPDRLPHIVPFGDIEAMAKETQMETMIQKDITDLPQEQGLRGTLSDAT